MDLYTKIDAGVNVEEEAYSEDAVPTDDDEEENAF
jgi:hypothetical protein